CQTYIRAPFTF
nr:immunoglobulin light chain junction region [Macaca mulatta]MOX47929.1 immunoglobulin light chain junction region [Macaca mulatta]MOX47973.1 immunoglobulin light chain junction region [Macaca mulatta]MOX48030.1 immunoglobulin light chain junction region [Macaca mulatta]MOX48055.1 immunoglobulin light chain junction region [Macaca mulatta]